MVYQILFLRENSRIIGVTETCSKHFGLKSSFFDSALEQDKYDESMITLEDLCPDFAAETRDIERVKHYLELEKRDFFEVNFSTANNIKQKVMFINHIED